MLMLQSSSAGLSAMDATELNSQRRLFSIKLCPPNQNTSQMHLVRATDNLTTKSIFTQKYGSLSKEEAEENAKRIEDVAFATANEHYEKEPDGDGSSAVQLYAKECSKLILEVLKRGPTIRDEKEVLASDKLKEVDLSEFIAGRPEAEALEVMNIFSTALEGSILKSLNLSNNALEEAAEAVCELIPSTEKLRVLQFHNNMTGDKGALAISRVVKCSPLLEDFRCSSTRVVCEGGIALSKALETCTHLKKLDLRDNMFGKEAGVALSKALSKYAGLTEVYLSSLNLEDEAEASPIVAACISEKQHLTKLNLAENELKDEGRSGARVLAKVTVQKPEFKYLNINGNFISDEGIDEVNELFEKFPDRLGSFDENDPEGGGDEEESGEGEDDEHELERKLENLEANKDE
ncbi:hypothetical protein Peur_005380 [Populus x canadensis]